MRADRAIAVAATCVLVAAGGLPAGAFTVHPAVTVRGGDLRFYAGHLVLDAQGGASLDDGTLHVSADRIILDLAHDRYVAAGHVEIHGARDASIEANGTALGVDLVTHAGLLIAIDATPATYSVEGDVVAAGGKPTGPEPLALPDLEGEQALATAAEAVAHLDADVRLSAARVLVPGGQPVPLPSFVYTFSSEVGYSASNVAGNGEEIPFYYGSTRDSIDGAHLVYNAISKVGLGFDHRIIDGDKAYDLFSVSPVNGPDKNAAFTWEEQIDPHASQLLNGTAAGGVGSIWQYSLNDSLHRSFVDLTSDAVPGSNASTIAWQGAYEPLGAGAAGSLFQYHLRTQYARDQEYSGFAPVYATTFESGLQAPSLLLDPSSSLTLSSDWAYTSYDTPERLFVSTYFADLQHRWNGYVATSLSDTETGDDARYPSIDLGDRSYLSSQTGTVSYTNGGAFALTFSLEHQAESTVPPGGAAQPWFAFADIRFRVNANLAIDVNRGYGFGFDGQRFGSLGFQIFP
jgi:hypothetical protein